MERLRRRESTPRDYEQTLELLRTLVSYAEREIGGRGTVGVGIPGAVSPASGLIKNANSTWLIGKPLDQDLATILERPVRLMNDANCFALSEASDGAAAGAASVFGVILGTGVGGGFVLDGEVVPGAGLVAGEWGHIPMPVAEPSEIPGPDCYCGRTGCVETWLSGPGLSEDHRRHTGSALSAEAIAKLAKKGQADCRSTLNRWEARLARSLAVVLNILDPEVVVLGGGLSNVPGLPVTLQNALPDHVFSDEVAARIVLNRHGDSSGVRGAAWLWSEAEAGTL